MNEAYTRYHPKWHRPRMPIFWWVAKRPYAKFISRELTSVFVAYGAVLLLVQAWSVAEGPAAYARFEAFLARPLVVAFHVCALAALVFHTVTWLNLAPQALALKLGGRRVPRRAVLVAHYLAWLAATGAVVVLLVVVA